MLRVKSRLTDNWRGGNKLTHYLSIKDQEQNAMSLKEKALVSNSGHNRRCLKAFWEISRNLIEG
jgi:hypothetical protein